MGAPSWTGDPDRIPALLMMKGRMRNLPEAELLESLAEFSRALPGHNVENIRQLFVVGEYGVGLEDLCTQLYEYSIRLTPGQ